MFTYNVSLPTSAGDVSQTTIGYFNDPTVVAGLVTVSTAAASESATVTIYVGSYTFVLPALDLSDIANQVPFVLPAVEANSTVSVQYSVDVTGSSGEYAIYFKV